MDFYFVYEHRYTGGRVAPCALYNLWATRDYATPTLKLSRGLIMVYNC